MPHDLLVTSLADAKANVDRYEGELAGSADLQAVMSYARAWHGYLGRDGGWRVAPSKFVGYAGNDAAAYARARNERDGRRTERALAAWSEGVAPGTAVHEDLSAAVLRLFARYGRTPNKLFRVTLLRVERDTSVALGIREGSERGALRSRITVDAGVCGGRPSIRGMRIRVSDILDMLATGTPRQEILADYPYLEDDDISASLDYAARTMDHRVVGVA